MKKEVKNVGKKSIYKKKVLLGCSSQPRPYNLDLLVEFLLLSINLLCVLLYLLLVFTTKKNLKVSSDLFLHVFLFIQQQLKKSAQQWGTTLSIKNANSKSSNQQDFENCVWCQMTHFNDIYFVVVTFPSNKTKILAQLLVLSQVWHNVLKSQRII